jgi:hypothetical protein
MTEALRREWMAILESRRRCNASGQDGSDFAIWLASRGAPLEPEQLDLFA